MVKIWPIRFAEDPEHLVGLVSRNPVEIINVRFIERLDHVTGGEQTSAPLHRRWPLYLKSYLDSLFAGYSEPPLSLGARG